MMKGEVSTRLREAIQLDDVSLVKRVLSDAPEMLQNPNYEDKSNTSLHLAALYGHAEIAVSHLKATESDILLTLTTGVSHIFGPRSRSRAGF